MTLTFSWQPLLTSIVIILRHSYHHLLLQHVYILSFNNQHRHSVSATRKVASFRNVKFKQQFLTQYLFFLVISVRILFYVSELPVSILHNLLPHTYKAHFTCHFSFHPVKTSNINQFLSNIFISFASGNKTKQTSTK